MTDGARVSPVSTGSCAASCLNWVRWALLLLWQRVKLQASWCAPPLRHLLLCAAALYTS
jgi:hypothetical protein